MGATTRMGRPRRPVFISWFPHMRRSDAIASALGGRSYMIHVLDTKRPAVAPVKYPVQAAMTLWRLWRDRPDAILVASPPFVAPLVVAGYALAARVPFAIDAHSGVFNDPKWSRFLRFSRGLSRKAVVTITAGDHYADVVDSWDAHALVIGDVPVRLPDAPPRQLGEGTHVVMPCSFSSDEPLATVLAAMREVPDITLHVTGKPRDPAALQSAAPPNVKFAGWLSDEDYAALLRAADVVLALTTRDHTMQRAAYEAMSIGTPLVTSSWPLLRSTFSKGTLFVEDDESQIAAALRKASTDRSTMAEEMVELRAERQGVFDERLAVLRATLGRGVRRRGSIRGSGSSR